MVYTRLSTMLSFKSQEQQDKQKPQEQEQKQQEPYGWKWEVNHDGVIWQWSHPTSSAPTPSALTPVITPVKKNTLVDYWYTVHDGIAIPWSGEP